MIAIKVKYKFDMQYSSRSSMNYVNYIFDIDYDNRVIIFYEGEKIDRYAIYAHGYIGSSSYRYEKEYFIDIADPNFMDGIFKFFAEIIDMSNEMISNGKAQAFPNRKRCVARRRFRRWDKRKTLGRIGAAKCQ